jgi:flavin-dependent dehydrogenase
MRTVRIIGGGLAGLTLGIALRQRGVPVVINEAGHYPRHRVCGEFISGRGREVLEKLLPEAALTEVGAAEAHSAAFFAGAVAGPQRNLPVPALCISRFALDAFLARTFRRLGGELHEDQRSRELAPEAGLVLASGRRLARTVGGWRWFGLKAHVRGVALVADLEMHLSTDGYVGLCRVENGEVNVCGLFRRNSDADEPAQDWRARLGGAPGSALAAQLQGAEWVEESFCAVAGLDLRPQLSKDMDDGHLRVGDALTMIPPFTGNGMSMAFESAALAVEPLVRWSRGDADWQEARFEVAQRCGAAFASRLRWAKWLHGALLTERLQPVVVRDLMRFGRLWHFLYRRTR